MELAIFDFSDHGYKLGEHCDWFKHDNYEDATRIVTIIKPADGLLKNPKPPGTIIEQLAEEVDMYPSLLVSSSTAIRVSQRLKCSESLFLLYAILCICCQSVTAMIGRTCTNGRICTAYLYRQSYRASRGCLCSRILPPTTRGSSGRSISTSVFCNFWLVCLQHWTLRLGAGFLASTHMASGNFLSYLITRG